MPTYISRIEEKDAKILVEIYLSYHASVSDLIEKWMGAKPKPYKGFEEAKLYRHFKNLPQSCDNLIEYSSRIMSN